MHSTIHDSRYTLHGTVIHGQKIGKKYGLPPTMNVALTDVPADLKHGIYVVRVRRTDSEVRVFLHGVAHFGPRPAVHAGESFEVHIFDFSDDWYGAQVEVEVGDYLRPVLNFDSIEELREQIEKDIVVARRLSRI